MVLRLALALAWLGGCPTSDTDSARTCDDIPEDAIAAVRAHQACTSTTECVFVNLYEIAGADNCLGAFQCHNAFPADADLAALADEAAALVDAREALACSDCLEASCMDPEALEARCNESTGLCEVVD